MSSVAATSASGIRTLEELKRTTHTSGSNLGQDDFLKILMAQMANQDPLEPTGNAEFLAQMAQFTMLEQIKEMGVNFATSQAYSMIGKYVYVQQDNNLIFGKVDGVVKENGINYLMLGGEMYDMTKVVGIVDNSSVETGLDEKILQSASLIGQTVTATVTAADGTKTTITGEVSRIVVKDGKICAVVDGKEVPVSNITEISTGTAETPAGGTETPADDTEPPTDTEPVNI